LSRLRAKGLRETHVFRHVHQERRADGDGRMGPSNWIHARRFDPDETGSRGRGSGLLLNSAISSAICRCCKARFGVALFFVF